MQRKSFQDGLLRSWSWWIPIGTMTSVAHLGRSWRVPRARLRSWLLDLPLVDLSRRPVGRIYRCLLDIYLGSSDSAFG